MTLLTRLSDELWSPWLILLCFSTGLLYSFGTGFFQIFGLRRWLGSTLGSLFHRNRTGVGVSPVAALAAALASTMGTGSIAGVAAAITMGGPGAVFWMWLTALLGMMTSYGEKYLTILYQQPAPRGGRAGGPMFYIREGLHRPGLARLFALAALPAALAGGAMIQSRAIASTLHTSFGLPPLGVGLVVGGLAALVIAGGMGRISRLASALVPLMSLLYLGSGLFILLTQARLLPQVFSLIFTCAFRPEAALGSLGGYSLLTAIRQGVSRGIFTNEAGLGTSAMAHGSAEDTTPHQQGMWGIFEVFVSTLLVCTVTALVILVSGLWLPGAEIQPTGAALTAVAFSHVLGPLGGRIVSLSLTPFAFTSILGWSYYAVQALSCFTLQSVHHSLYFCLFCAAILLGAVWGENFLWVLVDIFTALMALPNLIALIFLSPKVFRGFSHFSTPN